MAKRKTGFDRKRLGSHKVGYGRPPEGTRFKPGQSGNPTGGSKNIQLASEGRLKGLILKHAYRLIPINIGGAKRKIRTIDAIIQMLFRDALSGNRQSQKSIVTLLGEIEFEYMQAHAQEAPQEPFVIRRIIINARDEIERLQELEKRIKELGGEADSSSPGPPGFPPRR
jgi:hypothetical protein